MSKAKVSPYDWKFPVKDRELFVGRTEELADVDNEVARFGGSPSIQPVIVVAGERRVGKSSFLLRICEICGENSILPVVVNAEDPMVQNAWEFWHEIFSRLLIASCGAGARIVGEDVAGTGFGFLTPKQRTQSQTKEATLNTADLWFSNAYSQYRRGAVADTPASYLVENELKAIFTCCSKLDYKGIILILDEAQRLLNSFPLRQQLRNIVQHLVEYGIVFAGEPTIDKMFNDPQEPFFNQGTFISLKNFTKHDDIVACALKPLKESERNLMSPMTIDHIARLSQGKPNQIRLICDAIYSRYSQGAQQHLDISTDVMDDVIDEVAKEYQDPKLRARIERIVSLSSIDLELLHNMTRYPNWTLDEIVELDESFRGESVSNQTVLRRTAFLKRKQEYFVQLGLMVDDPERFSLVGGEFTHLYVRFQYEVRKYGELSRMLILGKGPPNSFGEKSDKLVKSISYALGQNPLLSRFIVHPFPRDEGDIVETVRHRFSSLAKIMKHEELDVEDLEEVLADCFDVCQLISTPGIYYILILSIRNLVNPRDTMHIELYFPLDKERGSIDLTAMVGLVGQQADAARVRIEGYGDIVADVPDFRSLLDGLAGAKLEEFLAKLDMITQWRIVSVQQVIDSQKTEHEETEDEKEGLPGKIPNWIELYSRGKNRDAIEAVESQIRRAQKRNERARLFNDLGYMRYGLTSQEAEIAKKDLEQAATLHFSNLPITLSDLSVIDIDQGHFEPAITRIEDALALTLSISEIDAAFLRLRLPENHLGFRVNWEQHPANVLEASYINLAYVTLKLKGVPEAHQVLEEGLSLIPSSVRLKHAKARLFIHSKDVPSALPTYNELAKLRSLPDNGILAEIKTFSSRLRKSSRKR
jgi:hypothetical protein